MSAHTAPSITSFSALSALRNGAPLRSLRTSVPQEPMEARFTLPAHEVLVSCLRRGAAAMLSRWRLSDDEQNAALLIVGELAANAAVHGRSEMFLQLVLTQGTLGIVVGDHGDPAPRRRRPASDDPEERGRGLDIVRTLSTRVDLHHDDRGTWILACLAVANRHPGAD